MKSRKQLKKKIKELKEQVQWQSNNDFVHIGSLEDKIIALNNELKKSFENFNRVKVLVEKTEQANIHLNKHIRTLESEKAELEIRVHRLSVFILDGITNAGN